jgi:hypothetical protein
MKILTKTGVYRFLVQCMIAPFRASFYHAPPFVNEMTLAFVHGFHPVLLARP